MSIKTATPQVVGYDDISDSVKDELNVVRVGGTRLVAVDFFRSALVHSFELRLNVCRSFIIGLRPYNRHKTLNQISIKVV